MKPAVSTKVAFRCDGKVLRGIVKHSFCLGGNDVLVHCIDNGNNYIIDGANLTVMDW